MNAERVLMFCQAGVREWLSMSQKSMSVYYSKDKYGRNFVHEIMVKLFDSLNWLKYI